MNCSTIAQVLSVERLSTTQHLMRHDGLASGVQQTVADAFGFVPRWDDDRNVEHNINNRKRVYAAGVSELQTPRYNGSHERTRAKHKQHRHVESGAAEAGQTRTARIVSTLVLCFPRQGDSTSHRNGSAAPAAVCGPRRHRIHVLLALVGATSLSGVRHHLISRCSGATAVEPLVVALVAHGWKRGVASRRQSGGRGPVVVGVLLTLFRQYVRTADDCHGPRFAGNVWADS